MAKKKSVANKAAKAKATKPIAPEEPTAAEAPAVGQSGEAKARAAVKAAKHDRRIVDPLGAGNPGISAERARRAAVKAAARERG